MALIRNITFLFCALSPLVQLHSAQNVWAAKKVTAEKKAPSVKKMKKAVAAQKPAPSAAPKIQAKAPAAPVQPVVVPTPAPVVAPVSAVETVQAPEVTESRFRLLDFRVNQISVFQSSGNSFSGQVSWAPYYRINPKMGVRASIGVAPLLGQGTGTFAALEYQVLYAYNFNQNWTAEAGLGAQTWLASPSSTGLMTSAMGHYKFNKKFLKVVDGAFLGYSTYFSSVLTHQIKAGIQLSFN